MPALTNKHAPTRLPALTLVPALSMKHALTLMPTLTLEPALANKHALNPTQSMHALTPNKLATKKDAPWNEHEARTEHARTDACIDADPNTRTGPDTCTDSEARTEHAAHTDTVDTHPHTHTQECHETPTQGAS
eukprot:1156772-Pelagomonas_calceolata.AAC.21